MPEITIISDLHLEFCDPCNLPGGDLLLMAGDIFSAFPLQPEKQDADSRGARRRAIAFCHQQLSKYERVLYIMGNHEHYRFLFEETAAFLRTFLAEHAPHVQLLDDEAVELNGVTFLGTTLWGRCGFGTADEYRVANDMRDFTAIRTEMPPPPGMALLEGRRTFRPSDAFAAHEKALAFLEASVPADKPVVLMTHHGPSFMSAHGHEYGTPYLDSAYCANLVDFFYQHPNIQMAIHGHTHHREHYRIAQTLVVANPRGYYPYERISKNFDPLAVDVSWQDLLKT